LKLPFPCGSKRVAVEKSLLELTNQFAVIIKPLPNSAIQFSLTIHFYANEDITKYEAIYKLSYYSFHLTQPSILAFGKDLFRCFERFNNFIGGSTIKRRKKTSLLLTSSANTPKSRPKSRSMRKLLSNKSESIEETPSESSITASTTTSNSGKSSSHIKTYSTGNMNKKLRPPCEPQRSLFTYSTPLLLTHQINRSVSDDNFGDIRNHGFTEREFSKKINPEKSPKPHHTNSLHQLNTVPTHRKQVVTPNPTNRRYSDIKLSPGTKTSTITFKKSQPLIEGFTPIPKELKQLKKGKNVPLIEHSDDVSLISEEELIKKENISRSSEDSSPDLLSLSD